MPSDADVLILTPSKGKWIAVFLIGLAFTAGGVIILTDDKASHLMAIFCIVFFGVVAIVGLIQLIPSASGLRIDSDGFTMRSLFRAHSYRWDEVGPFSPIHAGQKMVGFDLLGSAGRTQAASLAKSLSGRHGALPDSYGMSVEALATLMNERRDRAIGRPT